MAVGTRKRTDEIFAALDLRFSGISVVAWNTKRDTQQNARDDIIARGVDHVFLPEISVRTSLNVGSDGTRAKRKQFRGHYACRWHQCCQTIEGGTSVRRRFSGSSKASNLLNRACTTRLIGVIVNVRRGQLSRFIEQLLAA